MELFLVFLAAMLKPLSLEIILAALTSGLFLGAIYNHRLALPESMVYHQLIAGLTFIMCMFLFRLGSSIIGGVLIPNPAGWLGIGILWGIFCLFIVLGRFIAKKL